MIDEVNNYVEQLLKLEAEMVMLKKRKSLKNYEDGRKKLLNILSEDIVDYLGFEILDEDDKAFYYQKKVPQCTPRHLYKISEYQNAKIGKVYVVYVSAQEPDVSYKILREAWFIIKEGNVYQVVQCSVYTRFLTDGEYYQWENLEFVDGYKNITFDLFEEPPIAIKRYIQPTDDFDGLKHYNDNI